MLYQLTDRFEVRASLSDTWEFFSRPENFLRCTPGWMGMTLRTASPVAIHQDARIDYTMRWLGLSIPWRTRIVDWSPPRQLIYIQARGPYAFWMHQHVFTPRGAKRTEVLDRVVYKLHGGPLGDLVHAMIVKHQVLDIFRWRRAQIPRHFAKIRNLQRPEIRSI